MYPYCTGNLSKVTVSRIFVLNLSTLLLFLLLDFKYQFQKVFFIKDIFQAFYRWNNFFFRTVIV
jgi:hypothetical protein